MAGVRRTTGPEPGNLEMSNLSRRAFARSLLAAPIATLPIAAAASSAPASGPAHAGAAGAVPVARIGIGRFEVVALTDGYADFPFGAFTGRAPDEVEAAARRTLTARPDGVRLSVNQYLVRDGDTTILIDTGTAGAVPTTGRLPGALAAVGVAPEDVDAVILTHLHFDHAAGLVAEGRPAFPNAAVYADRRDIAYFTDGARRTAAPAILESSFDTADAIVRLYPNLQRTEGDVAIAPGVSLVDLTGHTPGHVGVRIEDGGEALVMVADMLFHPAVHPGSADVGFAFEQDPEAAWAMRERFFPAAAADGVLIAATHMPFPGLGRIANDGGRLVWAPADWAHGE